jgi:hypothetical protein
MRAAAKSPINDAGQVVGEGTGGGWIWDPVTGTRILDDLLLDPARWHIGIPKGISDRGQIVAWAWDFQAGASLPVVLTSIPEPTTEALLAVGLILLAALVRRQRRPDGSITNW